MTHESSDTFCEKSKKKPHSFIQSADEAMGSLFPGTGNTFHSALPENQAFPSVSFYHAAELLGSMVK